VTRAILEALRAGANTASDSTEDAFGLDLEFRARVAPIFQLLHDRYWRIEVTGARNVPRQGPVILISNHSGALPFDGAMICTTLDRKPGVVVRYLYDRFVEDVSAVDTFYRRTGGIVATRENAAAALENDAHLLVFPEGVPGVAKSFDERYRLRSFSPGFARLAMAYDIPVVPIAVVGAEEIYPVVGRAEGLSESLGIPYLPLTPFFPLFGILGAIPLPTKWFIRVGRPMSLGRSDDEERVKQVTLVVRRKLQAMVTRLRQRRRSIFLG
jgi:1-acyl-sn-glycerol-3-phosphate acyltransferase